MMPPIAVAIPLFFIFHDIGLRDTHLGLILAHTLINLPLVRGGIAATAVLCFIFSWTEFLISLQMTTSIRTFLKKVAMAGVGFSAFSASFLVIGAEGRARRNLFSIHIFAKM